MGGNVIVWAVGAIIGAAMIALGALGYPQLAGLFGPTAAIAVSILAQVAGLIVGFISVTNLLGLMQDQPWTPARDAVVDDVTDDLQRLVGDLEPLLTRGANGTSTLYHDHAPFLTSLRATLDSPRLRDRLTLMSAAFTPEMTIFLSRYLSVRDELRDRLQRINSTQFLGFTDGNRVGADGWRLAAVTDAFRAQFSDGDLMTVWVLDLGDLMALAASEPAAGWRNSDAFRDLLPKLSDVRDRCRDPVTAAEYRRGRSP